jgi:ATP-binding cassette subfamily F protein 3
MISLKHINLIRDSKWLLEDASLTLYAKQKIGLIGENGCGKTSFFAMLEGELEPHQGTLLLPNDLEIAQVKQEIPTTRQPAMEYVIDGDRLFRSLQKKLEKAEIELNLAMIARCHDELTHLDGYAIEGKAEKILKGLGFKSEQIQQPTHQFSGGWRMRLNLAQALMSRAQLLLLDEPTNHLDLDAIIWLEKWLQEYDGTLLVISHDREFLDNTVNSILHFEHQNIKLYQGDYSSFERQRSEQLAIQQATYQKQQHQIEHMQAFINRFRAKASKARQAQSRLKALQKIELVAAVRDPNTFRFSFKKPQACPNPLLKLEKINAGYDPLSPVLKSIDLQIGPEERIGLLGVNGAGKSTFIKLIAGLIQPFAGQVHFYKGLKIGYFAQHQVENMDLSRSPLSLLRDYAPTQSEQELRNFLGSFNFSGEMATNVATHLSGGEKARLALALIVWQAPNLLLLDEPTNHLDIQMREAIVLALQDYTGALILVSHDRHLVRTTTDELMIIANGELKRFQGDLDDYRESLSTKNNLSGLSTKKHKVTPNKEKRRIETELKKLEKELSALQSKKSEMDITLENTDFYQENSPEIIKEYLATRKNLEDQIEILEADWLELSEQI